jgi:hypothetical protein
MTQVVGNGLIPKTEAAKRRHEMAIQCLERLQNFAYRAKFVRNLSNREVVIVCIKVDSEWRGLVDILMPNTDWQKIRDAGQEPVARGLVMFNVCEGIAEILPGISDVLLEIPSEGNYKMIALDEGGGTVYEIEPKASDSKN